MYRIYNKNILSKKITSRHKTTLHYVSIEQVRNGPSRVKPF